MSAIEPYYDVDIIKEDLDEEDQTPNEDRIHNWGHMVDRKIDNKLRFLFADAVFPLTQQDFLDLGFNANDYNSLKELANEGVEAKFWAETNGQEEKFEKWEKETLPQWITDLTQVPSTTLS